MSLFDNNYASCDNRCDYKGGQCGDRCGCDKCNKKCNCDQCNEGQSKKWYALSDCAHPMDEAKVDQNFDQVNSTTQSTDELIAIKDSCDVNVHTTTTDAAVNVQVAIQVAIAIIVEISIADSEDAEDVKQDLLQLTKIKQCSNQRTIIENSRDVEVTTTDTNLAVSAQIAIQVLVALLVALDIL